jgi:hypothetical protein
LCLFTGISMLGVYFFVPPHFSGARSVFHQSPMLSVCYDGSFFVFQFCWAVDFGCCSMPQMSSVIHYLPCFGEWLIAHLLLVFLSRLVPCPSPFLKCTFNIPPPSAVVLDYSLLFVVQFFGVCVLVCPGAVLFYPRSGWGNST